MNRRIWATALGISALAFAGCGGDDSGSNGGSGGGTGKTIGYVSPIGSQPGQQQVSAGLRAGAKTKGWNVTILDANLSADRQVSNIDTLITKKADAIGSWSLDPNAVAGAYSRAAGAGIPVVGLNSEGDGMVNTVWWESARCDAGGPFEREAKWIAKRRPGGKVIIMGGPPVPSIQANVKCFTAAAKAAGLSVVGTVDNTKDTSSNASTLAGDQITKHPDADVYWAYNDSTALGISAALESAGKKVYSGNAKDGVIVMGVNGDKEAIAAVKAGRLTATIDPDTLASGMAVAKAMIAAIDKPDEKQTPIIVKSVMFSSENVDSWVQPEKRTYTLDNLPVVTGPASR